MDTETKKFWAMLAQTFTSVSACWDRQNGTMNTVKLERLLGVASSGERHMGLFFRDVWQGGSHEVQPFALVDAFGTVDREQTGIIFNWLNSPCRP